MRVVIVGCGRVGRTLAERLSRDGWDVAVIDKDRDELGALPDSFTGERYRGIAFDRDTLIAAGIERADVFVAVTSGDNSNVIAAFIAKDVFGVPKVVARIYEPRRAEIYRKLGIEAVSSVTWAVNEITALVAHPGMGETNVLGDGEVRIVDVSVPHRLVGRTVGDLTAPGEIQAVGLVRSGRSFIPGGGEVLIAGDLLYLSVLESAMQRLERMLEP